MRTKGSCRGARVLGLATALLVAGGSAYAQETGTVTGQVVDQITLAPVRGATVALVGTRLRASTDRGGWYRLEKVPAGERLVRAEYPGLTRTIERVRVEPSAVAILSFELEPVASLLGELLAKAERTDPGGGTVARVEAADLEKGMVIRLTDALAQVPGVAVLANSGQVGGASRVRLRGVSSFVGSNEPVIYLDGVRLSGTAPLAGPARGGRPTGGVPAASLLDSIDPATVERIEILRGPSAAARYGPEAAAGVILIYTRNGSRER